MMTTWVHKFGYEGLDCIMFGAICWNSVLANNANIMFSFVTVEQGHYSLFRYESPVAG